MRSERSHKESQHPSDHVLPDRDNGTFRATTPERGGFLDSNGNPVDTSNHLDDSNLATQKGHDLPMLEDKDSGMRSLWPAIWVFAAVILVIILLIIFLLQNAPGPSIGDADNIMDIFSETHS